MTRIELICDATAMGECQALQSALAQRAPKMHAIILDDPSSISKTTPAETLRVQLQIIRRASDFIVAQLIWTSPGQDPVTGPEVEVSAFDTPLMSSAQKDLARGLLQVSPLPI